MESFNKLYDRIADIVPLDGAKSEYEFFVYMTEEVGEVARCISENNGLKKYHQTESVLSECGDILNSLLGLYVKLGGSKEQLLADANKKCDKWEKRAKSNAVQRLSKTSRGK
jgi:NTP pyrophosphatase (non-canonical NTP hydrolase)